MKKVFCHALSLTLLATAVSVSNAATLQFIYSDGAGEGFNDASLGPQRIAAFENACNIWGTQLVSPQTIRINASFNPMGGGPSSALLGTANPAVIRAQAPGIPPNTWYPCALADALANNDFDPAQADIHCQFNSDVDNSTVLGNINWYYGLDGNPGPHVDFRSTVLHEIAHGLGFAATVLSNGDLTSDFPDIYVRQLARGPSASPSDPGRVDFDSIPADDSANPTRLSAITSNQLYWKGANVLAARANQMVKMYAPASYSSGSSVSHWDTSNSPDLLMEPFDTGPKNSIDLTKQAFQDMGWNFTASHVDEWSLY